MTYFLQAKKRIGGG